MWVKMIMSERNQDNMQEDQQEPNPTTQDEQQLKDIEAQ
jgi:hypothetical protein